MLAAVLLLSSVVLSVRAESVSINGAGATFPYPLYSKWFSDYRKIDPGVEINYQSIGSGGGIRQLLEKTIDFGASDSPMKDEQLAKASPAILHFPMVMGAVALTYNLPGFSGELRITPEILSDLFLGKIFYWNDPKIKAANPGASLPDVPVMIIHRSDGSGTTAVFTDYLAKISPEWKSRVGAGTAVKWPIGIGGKGNEGVTGFLKNSPGALGYVEHLYAEKNHLQVASLENSSGVFIRPSVAAVTEAAAGSLANIPKDFRVSITNANGKGAYPISSFTYFLVYKKFNAVKAHKLKTFIEWALTRGQNSASSLFYAPLPSALAKRAREQIKEVE